MHAPEPWFSLIKQSLKTVDARPKKGEFAKLKKDDIIVWNNKNDKFTAKVTNVKKYESFEEMLNAEKLNNVIPYAKTVNDGVNIYRQYYSKEDEKKYGILAVRMLII